MADISSFTATLAAYKQAIDTDIAAYAAYIRPVTLQQYGKYAALEVDTFLDILGRGGKRIRGSLVIAGYEMCGGNDRAMILQAARAIEMLHAYMLIIDDVQDRSSVRRGKPSAHELLSAYHRKHQFHGDSTHTGISLALNAALAGAHAAEVVLANLNVEPQLRLNALSITNRTMGITVHGQTYDILNEVVPNPSDEDIDRVLDWKTAQYSFVNPLHVGMVLAGADCRVTDAITPYGRHMGRAFQLTDDTLGIFGTEQTIGKSPLDDIREGKRTLLVRYTLQHAKSKDATFLEGCLGKQTLTWAEFERCRAIMTSTGAHEYMQEITNEEVAVAINSLELGKQLWSKEGADFLRDLAESIRCRTF
ncbi:MAG TPA: polyprenyl synthetase family protein [Patescibacteria group bacterium]|nr:polyprenyl synthetase family protein [Patescibacteria group bacterium]